MSAALTNQLRESLILERARRLYTLVTVAPEDEAITILRTALRTERDEGIKTGHDQAERFSHELEKAS